MKIAGLDDAAGRLERLTDDGDTVTVRRADLVELERRYHGQRDMIRKHLDFAHEVTKLVDRGLGELGAFRDKAYRAAGVGDGL